MQNPPRRKSSRLNGTFGICSDVQLKTKEESFAMSRLQVYVGAAALLMPSLLLAAPPVEVVRLVTEMRETGGLCRGGVSRELGVFVVGVGRARYRDSDIAYSREIAEINAKKQVSSALRQSFKAKDMAHVQLSCDEAGRTQATAFFMSHSETEIDQVMNGWQVVSSGKNADGDMEVVGFISTKASDKTDALVEAQLTWGSKGVVAAVGVDADRSVAEKNALRSAVEQVAGTLVVGKVTVNERDELHKRLATTAGALVEEYRVTKETKIETGFRIEILARVSKKKLYDSYRSYFKSLDDPMFCLVATDAALTRQFTQFFTDKGLRLTNRPEEAQYFIRLDGRFEDRPTPGNGKAEGTMLNLRISVESVDGSRTLLTMNEKQAKDSEILSREQRRDEVSRRIFKKLEMRLHQALQEMVIRMLDDADDRSAIKVDPHGTTF